MCTEHMLQSYGWSNLPDVCSNWYRVFRSNYPWRRFQFRDYIFTRRKFTSHAGWQYAIDHWRLRYLIMNAAPKWRQLEILPVTILFNLYEFIRVLTNFSEYYEKNTEDRPLEGIRSFTFKWQLHLHERGNQNAKMIGTGGEMLKSLSLLLSHLHGLNELELRELQLEPWECNHFVDDILYQFDSQLTSLCLINLTKVPRPFLQIGLFLYLEHLTVSPQHLDESVVILIADLRQLKSFIIYQNEKALGASAVGAKAWQAFSASNKHTRVYLIQAGKSHGDLLIQPNAPVYAIIYENSIGQLTDEIAQEICDNYSTSLQYLIQKGLERRYRPRQFAMRVDMPAVIIALRCAKLKLLAVRERISFGTALLLAIISARHKTTLCTRRNALLKRRNWTLGEVHEVLGVDVDNGWFREACSSYEALQREVIKITGSMASIITDNRYMYSFENNF
uniref:Uncharacterized protein n=1 Tax=Ascaris lumbricoides TaxID=6252 RepID=A0A9J2PN04_ASCLU